MQYCLKLSSNAQNPAFNAVFGCKFKPAFDRKPSQIPPLGIRAEPDLHAIGFKQKDILPSSTPVTPPWLLDHLSVNFDLHCFHKEDTPPDMFRSRFHEVCSNYDGYHRIYTDGSKSGDRVASAVIARNSAKTVRLPNKASIFRAELYAITQAMDLIRRSKDTKFIIFSDSMSSLEALNSFKIELDLVLRIIKDYTNLTNAGKTIEFCWIPSHVNIPGNERADTAAKAALGLTVSSMKLPACELIPRISKFCREEWQDIWNSAANNKLHAIYPVVGTSCHNNLITRREAVIINRLKIGHSRLTQSYLLSGEDQPTCTSCDAPLTVKHILLDCPDLLDVRKKYFTASSLRDIFESVDNQNIIGFIKDAHFYHKL